MMEKSKPFDFSELPRARHFQIRVRVVPPEMHLRPEREQWPIQQRAIKKALEIAKRFPDRNVACKLSFLPNMEWVVPVHYSMTGKDIRILDSMIRDAEVFARVALTCEKGKPDFEEKQLQVAMTQLVKEHPGADEKLKREITEPGLDQMKRIQDVLLEFQFLAHQGAARFYRQFSAPDPGIIAQLLDTLGDPTMSRRAVRQQLLP